MKKTFRGTVTHAIDHKKRVAPPKRVRQMLVPEDEGTFTLTLGLDGCLFLYTRTGHALLEEELGNLPMWKREGRRVERIFSEHTYDAPLDKQGRLRIPPELLEKVPFEKEVLFLGTGRRVEMWNPRAYQKYKAQSKLTVEQITERLFPEWGSDAKKR